MPGDRAFPIMESIVRVELPHGVAPEVTASYPDTWRETISGSVIIWEAPGRLGANDSVEVRVQYPHNPVMEEPGWQAGYDRTVWYEENVQPCLAGAVCLPC